MAPFWQRVAAVSQDSRTHLNEKASALAPSPANTCQSKALRSNNSVGLAAGSGLRQNHPVNCCRDYSDVSDIYCKSTCC
jgi:hypothetical protein